MTAHQEEEIQKVIVDKSPDQLKLSFALWNREAVRDLIEKRIKLCYCPQAIRLQPGTQSGRVSR